MSAQPKGRKTKRAGRRTIASAILYASLAAAIALPASAPAYAQVALPDQPPTSGMGVTSPLAARATRPTGIPLGSTEIAPSGVSPVDPSQAAAATNCAGSDSVTAPMTPFDGGGLSNNSQLSCADSQTLVSPLPSPSSAGPAGIPLGSTELGGAGISPSAPVATPGPPDSAGAITNPGNP
jgi:hypothetical protein